MGIFKQEITRHTGRKERDMKEFEVICWASEKIIVEAENEEDAEKIASEMCNFPQIDYCEVNEL